MKYLLEVVVSILQFGLSLYAFWLVWRVRLPYLPGPVDPDDRIPPYASYFTDPLLIPTAKALHAPTRLMALIALVVLAGLSVGLGRLPALSHDTATIALTIMAPGCGRGFERCHGKPDDAELTGARSFVASCRVASLAP